MLLFHLREVSHMSTHGRLRTTAKLWTQDKEEMGLVNIQEVLPLWSSKFILTANFCFFRMRNTLKNLCNPLLTCNISWWWMLESDCSNPGSGRSAGEGISYPLPYSWASLVPQLAKNLLATRETWVWFLGWDYRGLPFPSSGDLPNPGIEPTTPALPGSFFATEPPEKSTNY